MGYTHYWNIKKPLDPESFSNFVVDIKKLKLEVSKTRVAGINATNGWLEPKRIKCGILANQHEVVITGPCESLVIQPKDSGFDFCKTNEYDYDVVVTTALLLAKRHFADAILLSSDGGEAGFEHAKRVYRTITGEEFTQKAQTEGGCLSDEDLLELKE